MTSNQSPTLRMPLRQQKRHRKWFPRRVYRDLGLHRQTELVLPVLPTTAFALSWSRSSTLGSINYDNFLFVGFNAYLQRRLQTVLNAAARVVFRLRRYDHVFDALAILHWHESTSNWLMAYRVLNGMAVAPPATVSEWTRSGVKPARSSPSAVVVHTAAANPAVPSVNSQSCSFPVAASVFWNTLPDVPDDVQCATLSLSSGDS